MFEMNIEDEIKKFLLIRDNKICVCGRRSTGKTKALALKAIKECIKTPNFNCVIVVMNEYMKSYFKDTARSFTFELNTFETYILAAKENSILFKNNSSIRVTTATSKNVYFDTRGVDAVYLDDANHFRNFELKQFLNANQQIVISCDLGMSRKIKDLGTFNMCYFEGNVTNEQLVNEMLSLFRDI
jgi:hypothetical protein